MAIKKPAELDFSNKKFMCIISGQPGLGKTTLALSAPKPFLFDTDNGIARVRPEQRGVTSVVESYEEMLGDMDSDEYKAAESVVIDTGGMLVQLMKDWAKKQDSKAAKDGRAMYGVIKSEFDRLCYQIRAKDRKHLIVVFHTTEQQKGDTIQTRLSCEGGAKDIVWTPADFGGYMFMMGNKRMKSSASKCMQMFPYSRIENRESNSLFEMRKIARSRKRHPRRQQSLCR